MRELVALGEISNYVDTTRTGSLRVGASRSAIRYGCPSTFYNSTWTSTSYMEKPLVLGQQTEDYRLSDACKISWKDTDL
jgi:hypothetical protein